MSNKIGFNNFKAFGSKMQYFSKKPITLVYGPNSIGKSSLIHSQVYQHLLFGHNENDVEQTFIAGDELDLGGFENYVHKHNIDSDIDFEWKIRDKKEILEFFEFQDIENINELNIKFKVKKEQDSNVLLRSISFFINAKLLFVAHMNIPDLDNRIAGNIPFQITDIDEAYAQKTLGATQGTQKEMNLFFNVIYLKHIQRKIQYFSPIRHYPKRFELYQFLGHRSKFEQVAEKIYIKYFHKNAISRVLLVFIMYYLLLGAFFRLTTTKVHEHNFFGQTVLKSYESQFEGFSFLLLFGIPIFFIYFIFKGYLVANRTDDLKIGRANQLLSQKYHKLRKNISSSYDVWRKISRSKQLMKQLNYWLSDTNKLKSTYQIEIEKFNISILDTITFKIYKWFNSEKYFFRNIFIYFNNKKYPTMAHSIFYMFDKIHTQTSPAEGEVERNPEKGFLFRVRRYMENLLCPRQNRITRTVFKDIQKNTSVTPKDMGLGISQALPILVSIFSSKNKMHYIEQPELHLHPAVQMELMDEFIRSYHDNSNEFMLESHSEHMLLRVMKRMRQTANGTLEDESLRLTPDDVCLLYVDNNGNTTYVKELELDYDGALLDPWPNGFFEEGHNERFE